jgi:two-component system response regulator YesN
MLSAANESCLAGFENAKIKRLRGLFRKKFKLPLEALNAAGVPLPDAGESACRQPLCSLLYKHEAARTICLAEHARAIEWAFKVGEPYSFVCHAGLLTICIPVANGKDPLGAFLTGKTWPEKPSAEMVLELRKRLVFLGLSEAGLKAAVQGHSALPGETLQQAATELFNLAQQVLALDLRPLKEQRERAQQQARIAETIHAVKRNVRSQSISYPFEREKDLIEKVKLGDKYGAKGVLNEILGVVLFHNPLGSAVLKTRLVELLAVLSRAAAEAGVGVEKVLERNLVYFREILNADDDSILCVTITSALNDFLATVCSERASRADTPVTSTVRYIEKNFAERLTVRKLSQQAHLSPSRLAHLFKEQISTTMMETVARVRMEQAKKLLLGTNLSCTEIAFRVGYGDQSYFTRIFSRREKVTPRQFRVLNRNSAG